MIGHRHIFVNRWHKSYTLPGKTLVEEHGKENWKVVHLVRDPIARNLSHFWTCDFQCNVKPYKPDINQFRDRFLLELDHWYGVNFIGNEIEPFWEIEIPFEGFRPPFTIYEDKIAIMRYEDFDCRNDLLRDFFGVSDVKYEPPRIQCSGKVGEVDDYWEILNTIRLPEMYVNLMYTSRYMRAFYSREEIDILRERWTKGVKADHPIIQKQETIRDAHDPKTCRVCVQYRERRRNL